MAAIPVGPGRAEPEPGGTRAGAAVNAIGAHHHPKAPLPPLISYSSHSGVGSGGL